MNSFGVAASTSSAQRLRRTTATPIHAAHAPRSRQIVILQTRDAQRHQKPCKSQPLLPRLSNRRMNPDPLTRRKHHPIRFHCSVQVADPVTNPASLLQQREFMVGKLVVSDSRLLQPLTSRIQPIRSPSTHLNHPTTSPSRLRLSCHAGMCDIAGGVAWGQREGMRAHPIDGHQRRVPIRMRARETSRGSCTV